MEEGKPATLDQANALQELVETRAITLYWSSFHVPGLDMGSRAEFAERELAMDALRATAEAKSPFEAARWTEHYSWQIGRQKVPKEIGAEVAQMWRDN